jgi:hypothetical protein
MMQKKGFCVLKKIQEVKSQYPGFIKDKSIDNVKLTGCWSQW